MTAHAHVYTKSIPLEFNQVTGVLSGCCKPCIVCIIRVSCSEREVVVKLGEAN